ncbi:MAG: FAD-dependent oxidoreductase [Streptomyces sp.]
MSRTAKSVVVIGAGPYGLSTAAHLRARGLNVRAFGSPMASWSENMPAGMFLKSPLSASSLSAPGTQHTLSAYGRAMGEPIPGGEQPVPIELFIRYGLWFAEQLVPGVEDIRVLAVDRHQDGFRLKLSSGEELQAQAVVVASGLTGFAHVPGELAAVTPDGPSAHGPVSHSSHHCDLGHLSGKDVLVVGAGQSALESAALLKEADARPRLLVRAPHVNFGAGPTPAPHWQPDTPLGRSWALYGVVNHAAAFRRLPESTRLRLVRKVLGPFGSWWLKPRVQEQLPVLTGRRIVAAAGDVGGVTLSTVDANGRKEVFEADHVLAATGYRVRLDALGFLAPELRADLSLTGGFPYLSKGFGSSTPGLYFTGLPAAGTFGPVMRFVCGTRFASPRIAAAVAKQTGQ